MMRCDLLALFSLLLGVTFAISADASGLTVTEDKINTYIANHTQAQVALLEKLVNINSGTSNIRGVRRVGRIVEKQLRALGFNTRWVEEPASMKRAGTLIAEKKGKSSKHILLIGHLDTVFAKDTNFRKFVRKKNTAVGPGVIDDKGGIVVILYALKALQATDALSDCHITVVLTGDEESSGKPAIIARKPLIDLARHVDIALDFEPIGSLSEATIARRGVSIWRIQASGHEAHSAGIFQPEVGSGAAFELARVLNEMRLMDTKGNELTFNPGVALAGTDASYDKKSARGTAFGKDNVVAKVAIASGDYRYLQPAQKQFFESKLRGIASAHLPGTSSTVVFEDGIPAMPPTDNNLALLEKYSTVSTDLGAPAVKPTQPGVRGAGDISHIAHIVPATLSSLGAVGGGAHSPYEDIELKALPTQTKRAAVFIYRLSR